MAVQDLRQETVVSSLKFVSGGYHGTVLPEDAAPLLWYAGNNLYRLPTGRIKRFRRATLVSSATSGFPSTTDYVRTLFGYGDSQQDLILADIAQSTNKLYAISSSWTVLDERVHPFYGSGNAAMGGLWSRIAMHNVCYECNATVKMRTQGVHLASVSGGAMWNWGIYPSKDIPTVTLAAGAITSDPFLDDNGDPDTTIPYGRKYAFASVNNNSLPRAHVSTRSPETAFQIMTAQKAEVEAVQTGTITTSGTAVTGTSTTFHREWIGMKLWIESVGTVGYISAYTSATAMTLSTSAGSHSGKRFFVYDPQVTHIRWYATANGGAVFLRIGQTTFDPTQTTTTLAGLRNDDNNNAEPGETGASYTTEESEDYNDPPPIGQWLKEWQGRILMFGVPEVANADGNLQTVFYSNVERTVVGCPGDSFAPFNRFTLPIGGALIGGAGILPTGLILFSTKNHMFKITGYLEDQVITDNFGIASTLVRLPFDVGCCSPSAVKETPQGLFWISPENQLWWYNDVEFPRYVGLPVQDILNTIAPSQKGDIKMAYRRKDQKEWLVITFPKASGTSHNDQGVILDLTGFNPDSPNFYPFTGDFGGLLAHIDAFGTNHLIAGGQGKIFDLDYNGSDSVISEDSSITGSVTFHAVGNDTPSVIKDLKWVRFRVNTDPSDIVTATAAQIWNFATLGVNDDQYTFAAPLTLALIPGVDSPDEMGTFTHAPTLFKLDREKLMKANRIQFKCTFPTAAADWELREIQYCLRNLPAR